MRKKINILLGGLIAIFTGCNASKKATEMNQVVALYGVPYATYNISGKVVNQHNKPVQGANVIIKGYKNNPIADLVSTNSNGQFNILASNFPTDTINIVVSDPTNKFAPDSIQHSTSYTKKEQKRGFYRGECNIETKITIKQ